MKHVSLTLSALAWVLLSVNAPSRLQDPVAAPVNYATEIFHAVLEGLYEDGVRNDAVDLILKQQSDGRYCHFVPGCPTCIYVLEALRHYRARPPFVSLKGDADTWGKGLTADQRTKLASPELKVRLLMVHTLVQSWIDRRMNRLRLNKRERAQWHLDMEERAKEGMKLLELERQAGHLQQWQGLECPSCVGAVAASDHR